MQIEYYAPKLDSGLNPQLIVWLSTLYLGRKAWVRVVYRRSACHTAITRRHP